MCSEGACSIAPICENRVRPLASARHPKRLELRSYGFSFHSVHNIKVEINGYNQRAIRFCERLGFRLVRRVREALLLNGNRRDQVVMDLLRTEFELKHVGRFESLPTPSGTAP